MEYQLPQPLITRRELQAIQHFDQSLPEAIPAGEIIRAERRSNYARMTEVIWRQGRYLVYDRDLNERTEPARKALRDAYDSLEVAHVKYKEALAIAADAELSFVKSLALRRQGQEYLSALEVYSCTVTTWLNFISSIEVDTPPQSLARPQRRIRRIRKKLNPSDSKIVVGV